MGIYLEYLNNEQAIQYNVMFEYIFDKETDAEKLVHACDKVFAHYAAFSASISMENGTPELVLLDKAPTTDYIKGNSK